MKLPGTEFGAVCLVVAKFVVTMLMIDVVLWTAVESVHWSSSSEDNNNGGRRNNHQQRQRQVALAAAAVQPSAVSDNEDDPSPTSHAISKTRPRHRSSSTPCRPVIHEVLWYRLDVSSSSLAEARRRRRRIPAEVDDDTSQTFPMDSNGDNSHRSTSGVPSSGISSQFDNDNDDIDNDRSDEVMTVNKLLLNYIRPTQKLDDATNSSHMIRRRQKSSKEPRRRLTRSREIVERHSLTSHESIGQAPTMTLTSADVTNEEDKSTPRRTRRNMADGEQSTQVNHSAHLRQQPEHKCRLETYWKKMPSGTFPPYIETGRCRQSTCMFGLYECRPRFYSVKILRRLPRRCDSVLRQATVDDDSKMAATNVSMLNSTSGTESANAAIAEVWRFVEYPVVVGCECSQRRQAGTFVSQKLRTTRSSSEHRNVDLKTLSLPLPVVT